MAPVSQPTIVLCPGAGHTVGHWAPVCAALEAKGFPSISYSPPSVTGEDATALTIDDDSNYVREQVVVPLLDEGKHVVLVMHSYAGAYAANGVKGLSKQERAEKGLPGGIVGLIWLAALLCVPGEGASATLEMTGEPVEWVGLADKAGAVEFTNPGSLDWLWPSLPRAEQVAWYGHIRPHSASAVSGSVSYAPFQDAYFKDLCALVHATDDKIVHKALTDKFIAKSGIALVEYIDAPHGVGVEKKDELRDLIIQLVEKLTRNGRDATSETRDQC